MLHKRSTAATHNVQVEDYALGGCSLDLEELLEQSWLVQLKAENKSPHTMRIYRSGVRAFLDFCDEHNLPRELSKSNVIAFMASRTGEASTAVLQLRVLKIFARWLAAEEDFDASGMLSVRPPKTDQPAVADLSEDEIKRMLKACDGAAFRDRRDKAMLAILAETGLRAAEMVALDVNDIDVAGCVAHVVRGKGGKGRRVKFSAQTAALLDRYLRARRQSGYPREGALWLNRFGDRLGYMGMVQTLKHRADDAGVKGFHLHRLRHSAAVRWMHSGGSQVGLMAQAGWSSPTMVGRYVQAANERLSHAEFDRLGLSIND
jgi:site-specific recombinase XerD